MSEPEFIDDNFIDMMSGRMYLDAPVFDITDIAHGLSLCCRFTGRIKRFYSIANHSLLVSKILETIGGNPLEGLLHDGGEQAMSDLARPIKHRPELAGYRDFEKRLDGALRTQFGLPVLGTKECKIADTMALWLEARELMPGGGYDWKDPYGTRGAAYAWAEQHPWPWLWLAERPLQLKPVFLGRYKELTACPISS